MAKLWEQRLAKNVLLPQHPSANSDMDRRNFLRSMIGGVAAGAAVRSFPFRVFSFPTNIVVPTHIFRGEFPALLAPGLRHIFLNYTALHDMADEQSWDLTPAIEIPPYRIRYELRK